MEWIISFFVWKGVDGVHGKKVLAFNGKEVDAIGEKVDLRATTILFLDYLKIPHRLPLFQIELMN